MPKSWILVSSEHNTFTQFSSESLTSDISTCAFLSSGTLRALHGFSPSRCSVLWIGPSCLDIIDEILPCSSGLIPHRSHDHWRVLGWFLTFSWSLRLHEVRSCMEPVILCFFYLWIIRTDCYHLLTELLGDGLEAHSSFVGLQSCPWHPWTALGLGHAGEFGLWLIDCFCGQVSFIQVTSWDSL